jgi:hypothetical protein
VAIPIPSDQEQTQQVISPFAQTTSMVPGPGRSRSGAWVGWLIGILVAVLAVGTIGYFAQRYLNDPYRTLEPFPMDKYLSDYRSLSGTKFKAEVKVANDLGSKPGVGRLMVFTIGDDNRPLVVLLPPNLSGIYFNKGQNYKTSLEVGQGGLVYADSCEKD